MDRVSGDKRINETIRRRQININGKTRRAEETEKHDGRREGVGETRGNRQIAPIDGNKAGSQTTGRNLKVDRRQVRHLTLVGFSAI